MTTSRTTFTSLCCLSSLLLIACSAQRSTSPYTAASDSPRDPRMADLCNSRAADLMDTDPQQAENLLRDALAADLFHGPAHNNLGVLLLHKGDLYGAATEFEWARKLLPGSPDPRLNLALTLETAGRTDDALAEYRHALGVRPGHLPTAQALTRLEVTSNQRCEDTTERLRAIALDGYSTQWRNWAMLELAKAIDRPRP
jgi:Tfp pilus assembly protein PilF